MSDVHQNSTDADQNQDHPGAVVVPGGIPVGTLPQPQPTQLDTPDAANTQLPAGTQQRPSHPDAVAWAAPEFVTHDKSAAWFMALAVAAVLFAVLIYLLSKDLVSSGVIVIAAIIFGTYGNHKPRELTYELRDQGILVGSKGYTYDEFKSFSVKPEGQMLSITFMPMRRFAVPLTIYYPPELEENIMKKLAARMPYEEPRRDTVDNLMKRIRF